MQGELLSIVREKKQVSFVLIAGPQQIHWSSSHSICESHVTL